MFVFCLFFVFFYSPFVLRNYSTDSHQIFRDCFADIPTELPCLGDLENSGHLPVQEVFKVTQTFVP